MSRRLRRTTVLSLLLALAALWSLVSLWRWAQPPNLSSVERRLMGLWGLSVAGAPADFGLLGGPIARPLMVMELRPDGVYRPWIATTDRPFPQPPQASWGEHQLVEGRWAVIGGRLRVEDAPGAWRGPARVARDAIAARTGLVYPSRSVRSPTSLSFRFTGPTEVELTSEAKTLVWQRLSPGTGDGDGKSVGNSKSLTIGRSGRPSAFADPGR